MLVQSDARAFHECRPIRHSSLRAWLMELDSRADEVRETFRDESVRAEQAHIVAGNAGPLLVYVMEAEDFDRGGKAYTESRHQIETEHREVMRECLAESPKLDPVYDVALETKSPG